MTKNKYAKAKKVLISEIIKNLLPDGSFISFSMPGGDFSFHLKYRTTFFPSLILRAIADINDDKLVPVKQKIGDFLLSQKSSFWSFNYWAKDEKEYKKRPYPDDLDDTFCALAALASYDKEAIDGQVLAKIASLLVGMETGVGGPYRTWIVRKDCGPEWQDVDIAVNSNIAAFMKIFGVNLEKVKLFVEEAIESGDLKSPYYPSIYPVIYFVSQFYQGTKREQIISLLLSLRQRGIWHNPLDTALALSSLLNMDHPPCDLREAADYLVSLDEVKSYPFCCDPAIRGKKYVAGSSALTAAFCLKALFLYEKKERNQIKKDKKEVVKNKILLSFERDIAPLNPRLQKIGRQFVSRLVRKDSQDQILLLPYFMAKDLRLSLPSTQIISLCKGSLYGWIAYTIYDKVLDGERADKLISFANFSLRELTRIYQKMPKSIAALYDEVLRQMDSANQWEAENCAIYVKDGVAILPKSMPEFGDLGIIAQKSYGHALGSLSAILLASSMKTSYEFRILRDCLVDYIVARQLSDDLHDWQDDLRSGKVTYVVSEIVKKARKKNVIQNKICFSSELESLKEIFWLDVVDKICEEIIRRGQNSSVLFKKIAKSNECTVSLLECPLRIAKATLEEQKRTCEFISHYTRKS